jgi:chaperonin GroES
MIRVLNNYILLKPEDPEKKLKGIVLPEQVKDVAKQQPPCGTVVSVGPGNLLPDGSRVELSVKPGDIVLLDGRMVRRFEDEGESYVICTEEAIMGVKVTLAPSLSIVEQLNAETRE